LLLTVVPDAERICQDIKGAGWVGKPFDMDDLLAELARVVGR
jgi:hypothetical protein